MSYGFTVYTDRASIATTKVYSQTSGKTYSYSYGTGQQSLNGFTDGDYITFTAEPASGYTFQQWIYHIGSPSATRQYSTSNPFKYYGSTGNDIYIAAEGVSSGGTDSPWMEYEEGIINVYTSDESVGVTLWPYEIHRYTVKFDHTGYANFYTTGSVDTIGYLSTSPKWNSECSGPLSPLTDDDDGGDGNNFKITYRVTAGVDYYIFVRGCSGEESGDISLKITVPWDLNSANLGTISGTKSVSVSFGAWTLCRRSLSFSKSGQVTISTSGDADTFGWFGDTSDFYKANPTSHLAYDDDSGDGNNLSITYDVQAGKVYYIWLRHWSFNASCSTTLNISAVTESTTVAKWSWSASNGTASVSQTSASYSAIVNKTATTNLSHLVWNDMVAKVNEILAAKGITWDTYYATYSNTLMNSYPYELTADKFNSIRNNLNFAYWTNIEKVSSGDPVLGSYFITLANCINNAIDNL